ncbi:MAG: hypothetical protein M1511_15005 [Deltaproteobacteria bacterium]|nr:hypothetical protein [Deltaproteobacteria bacterium]
MIVRLLRGFEQYQVVLTNASSLVATYGMTSAVGFVYWWIAARKFSPEAVGFASAAISSMQLAGTIGVMGLGTLLIGELPRQPGKEKSLISTALLLVSVAGFMVGLLFAKAAASVSVEFVALAKSLPNIVLFSLGASLTAVTIVFDQAVIGLLRGGLQLKRNAVFSVIKLIGLFIVGVFLQHQHGSVILFTWVLGNLMSLLAFTRTTSIDRDSISEYLPQWSWVGKLGKSALEHHLLNIMLQTPGLVLPLLVASILSAKINAYFYTSWMIANFAYVWSAAFSTVLYAVGSAEPGALARKLRLTLGFSLFTGLVVCLFLFLYGGAVLSIFGEEYAEQASWSLKVFGIGVFPVLVKNHYVAICRIHKKTPSAVKLVSINSILEIILAGIGANFFGLLGLSIGWLFAISLEAMLMLGTVRQVLKRMNLDTSAEVNRLALERSDAGTVQAT